MTGSGSCAQERDGRSDRQRVAISVLEQFAGFSDARSQYVKASQEQETTAQPVRTPAPQAGSGTTLKEGAREPRRTRFIRMARLKTADKADPLVHPGTYSCSAAGYASGIDPVRASRPSSMVCFQISKSARKSSAMRRSNAFTAMIASGFSGAFRLSFHPDDFRRHPDGWPFP